MLFDHSLTSSYNQTQKVLLDGLHDPESSLNMLRWPNDVRSPVMKMIWDLVTEDWEVFSNHHLHHHWWYFWHHILISAVRSSTKEALLVRLPDQTSNLRFRRLPEETSLQSWSHSYPLFHLLLTSLLLGNKWLQTRNGSWWLKLDHNIFFLFHDFCTALT